MTLDEEYGQIIDEQKKSQSVDMNLSAGNSLAIKPDTSAKVIKLSGQSGLPQPVVERNVDKVEKQQTMLDQEYAEILTSPKLKDWIGDKHNRALVNDDMLNLGTMQWILEAPGKAYDRGNAQKDFAGLRYKSMFGTLDEAQQKQLDTLRQGMTAGGDLGTETFFGRALVGASEQVPNLLGALRASAEYGLTGAVAAGSAAALFGQMGPQIATPEELITVPGAALGGYWVGSTAGMMQYSFRLEAGHAYEEFSNFKDPEGKPLDPAVAKVAALAAGSVNAGLEAAQVNILLRAIPGVDKLAGRYAVKEALRSPTTLAALTQFAKTVGGTLTAETAIEVGQRAVTILAGEVAKIGTDIESKTPKQATKELVQEGVGALEAFAYLSIPGPTMRLGMDAVRVQQAKTNEDLFKALADTSTNSKLRERLPEKLQEVVEKLTIDGPIENVYIPPRVFAEYFQSKKIDPRQAASEIYGSPEQFDQAMASGTDMMIPTARYAVTLAPTEHNAFFVKELKTDPLGMSSREADEFVKAEQAKAKEEEKALEESATTETVQAIVSGQLQRAGHEPKTADALAAQMDAFFQTTAQRVTQDGTPTTGLQLFKQFALNIVRKVAGREEGQVFEQPAWHSSRHEFDQFSMQNMGGGEGQQVHGWGLYFSLIKDINTTNYKSRFSREMGPDALTAGEYQALKNNQLAVSLEAMRSKTDAEKAGILDSMIERQNQRYTETITALDRIRKLNPNSSEHENAIYRANVAKNALAILQNWKSTGNFKWKTARQYEVDLDVDPANMLDLDATLSAQSTQVIDALKKAHDVVFPDEDSEWITEAGDFDTGREFYRLLVDGIHGADSGYKNITAENRRKSISAFLDIPSEAALLDRLTDEYQSKKKEWNLPSGSADEVAWSDWATDNLTHAQIEWLKKFVRRWEKIEDGGVWNNPPAERMASEILSKAGIKGLNYVGQRDGPSIVMLDASRIQIKGWEQSARKNPFPDSKVQQVVYHGTEFAFDKFSRRSIGKNYGSQSSIGFWFTNDLNEAEEYAKGYYRSLNSPGANIRPTFINLTNPKILRARGNAFIEDLLNIDTTEHGRYIKRQLKSEGYDGVILINEDTGQETYAVFDSKNIKSALTFDQDKARGRLLKYGEFEFDIQLMESADFSTFLHESGHYYLEVMKTLAKDSPSIAKDLEVLTQWMGVDSVDAIQVEHHEQFARGLEAYFMEGKAPSIELRAVFARFRSWLMALYRKLTQLDVRLNDNVRGVMDRMFATDVEIQASQRENELVPVFTTAEEAGMTPEQFERYKSTIERANIAATEELQQKILDSWQRESKAWWREQHRIVRAEVEEEILKRQDVAAYRAIRYGRLPDGTEIPPETRVTLDRQGISDIYAGEATIQSEVLTAARRFNLYRLQGGMHPDEAAPLFGFKSGDHLVQAMLKAVDYREQIDARTDQLMNERYGNILIDGTMVDEAREAVMNTERSKLVHAELKALTKKRNEVQPFVQEEKNRAAAARTQGLAMVRGIPDLETFARLAKARIGSMQVRWILPHQFMVAARKASEQAVEAAVKGDYQTAAMAKQQELFNMELYREANKARKEADVIADRSRDLLSKASQIRLNKAGQDYLDQVHELLHRFDFTPIPLTAVDRRSRLADWIERKANDGTAINLDPKIIDETFRKPYKALTMDELRGVDEALQHINHLAKFKNKLIKSQDKRDLDAIKDEVETSIRENGKDKDFQRTGLRLPQDEAGRLVYGFFASHRKLSSFVKELDGWKDGGPLWRLIMRPLNDASAHEATMTHDTGKALKKLFEPYTTMTENIATAVTTGTFGLVEKGLYRKEHIPAINDSLSKMEMLLVALNLGNTDNRTKLKAGYQWTDAQIDAITNRLTKADWDFVQGVWDLIESYWPEIEAKEKRVNGVAPKRVEPTAIITPHGEYRGGYFPLKYEDRLAPKAYGDRAKEAAESMLRGAYTQATTQRGHTKERVENVKMPVRLDFGVIFEHMHQVIHDLSFHEYLIDVNKILGSRRVQAAIIETHGSEVLNQMKTAIEDVAAGEIPAVTSWEKSINWLRHGTSIAAMGWNVFTATLQPLGLSQSIQRVGAPWIFKGMTRILGDATRLENAAKWVFESSEFMRNRYVTINREINELRNTLSGQTALGKIGESYFWLIGRGQMIADLPTWIGAYERYMHEGQTEENAVALADQAVLDSQGGGQVKDLAQIQRGGPLMKLWTNFYNYFNVTYNLTVEAVGKTTWRSPKDVGRLAVDLLLLYTFPAMMAFLLRATLRGDDIPEDEDLYVKLLREQMSYLFGTMIGARELSGVIAGYYGYEGPTGTRFYSEAAKLMQQAAQGEADAAAARAANQALGIVLHYPAGQVQRSVEGIVALTEGRAENPLAMVFGPPKEK